MLVGQPPGDVQQEVGSLSRDHGGGLGFTQGGSEHEKGRSPNPRNYQVPFSLSSQRPKRVTWGFPLKCWLLWPPCRWFILASDMAHRGEIPECGKEKSSYDPLAWPFLLSGNLFT